MSEPPSFPHPPRSLRDPIKMYSSLDPGSDETLSLRYVKVRGWATVLHAIAPLCIAYCAFTFFRPSWSLPYYLGYYALAETLFYIVAKIYRTLYLQRPALHPDLPTPEERRELFDRCARTTTDYEAYISKWFLGTPISEIKRENVREFFRWAFFCLDAEDHSHDDEVEQYLEEFEETSGLHFEEGRSDIKSLRLTLDRVDAMHRSLTWYFCIFVVDNITHAYMLFHGFQHYRISTPSSMITLPPRPQVYLTSSQRSPVKGLSYWYRPHTSTKHLPILFLHGIGVGLYPYVNFLKELNETSQGDQGIGIIAIEIMPISSRITSPILRKEAMCAQISSILQHHGFENFMLLTHSYGSVLATHLLKTPSIASRISSLLLVDPITILLNQPDVAFNFTVRQPKSAQEWLLWYFGSKDIGVAHTLGRQFFWQHNILWKEDLRAVEAKGGIFLSGKDSIVNAPLVRSYLLEGDQRRDGVKTRSMVDGNGHGNGHSIAPKKEERPELGGPGALSIDVNDDGLTVIWAAELDHANVFDIPAWRTLLKEETLKLARRDR